MTFLRKILSRNTAYRLGRVLLASTITGTFAASIAWISINAMAARADIDTTPYLYTNPSPTLTARDGRILNVGLNTEDAWSIPVELTAHSRYLRPAIIAIEDKRFDTHSGVDIAAVIRAAFQAIRDQRVSSGASTLTMQLVKMTDHSPRTLSGKLKQMWTAIVLEKNASKNEILAAYLNRTSYGSNLIGIQAASYRYFGKPSSELTLSESALLAAIPKSPARFNPLINPDNARKRRDFVLYRMLTEKVISLESFSNSRANTLTATWNNFPARTPHLSQSTTKNTPTQRKLTIDFDEQIRAESILQKHIAGYGQEVTHGAVIVINVQTGEILARVGSPEFFNPLGGQIDMVTQPRSPGSTLKPFVYAQAMEQNRLYPSEAMLDDTLDFGQYSPGNYNGKFNGLVTATNALRYSLNVPAVMILDRVGAKTFHQKLRTLGLTTLEKEAQHYGLGLTLGNCETRLDELAAAYLSIANLGQYQPLKMDLNQTNITKPKRVWTTGVATAMYEMLEQPLPRELHSELIQSGTPLPRLCWKTGTSTGHHDAWAFVFNQQYLVGVWTGNVNGKRSDKLIGSKAALPLAGRIFRGLKSSDAPAWPSLESLRQVQVCATSGLPSGNWCQAQKSKHFPKQQFINRTCALHKKPGVDGVERTIWPADARHWDLAKIQHPTKSITLPAKQQSPDKMLRITSPANNTIFRLTHVKNGDRIRLKSSLDESLPIFWYRNEQYLGQSTLEKPLYLDLATGNQTLSCMTPTGQTDTINFQVN